MDNYIVTIIDNLNFKGDQEKLAVHNHKGQLSYLATNKSVSYC